MEDVQDHAPQSHSARFCAGLVRRPSVARGAGPISPDRTWAGLRVGFLFLYPLPAAIVAMPLAPPPELLAQAAFLGIGMAGLTWAMARVATRSSLRDEMNAFFAERGPLVLLVVIAIIYLAPDIRRAWRR
jgi:hypothetical protein